MVRAFGNGFQFRGFRDVARRTTFLVDGEGVIRAVWEYESSDQPDLDEWLAACRDLSPET